MLADHLSLVQCRRSYEIVIEKDWVVVFCECGFDFVLLSETFTVNEYVPVCFGLPVITPFEFSLRPGGREPDLGTTDHLYGGLPPTAVKGAE
jgi:hypothetical protein